MGFYSGGTFIYIHTYICIFIYTYIYAHIHSHTLSLSHTQTHTEQASRITGWKCFFLLCRLINIFYFHVFYLFRILFFLLLVIERDIFIDRKFDVHLTVTVACKHFTLWKISPRLGSFKLFSAKVIHFSFWVFWFGEWSAVKWLSKIRFCHKSLQLFLGRLVL